VLGLAFDIGGALIGLGALSLLPISIAQPIFCNGLVVLAAFSALYLKETLRPIEWLAVAVCLAGTTMLALTLVPTDWSGVDLFRLQVKMGFSMLAMIIVIALLEIAASRAKQADSSGVVELVAGSQAGLCIGAGNAGLSLGLRILGVASGATLYIAIVFVVIGISFTSAHPVFANRGYKMGRVVIITAYMTLISLACGVILGVLVLGEPWPSELATSALRIVALVTISVSILLLNWYELCPSKMRGLYSTLDMS